MDEDQIVEVVALALFATSLVDGENLDADYFFGATDHCGDCTDVPMSCALCLANDLRDAACAAWNAAKAALAEAGMVIVPREPTLEMIAAGQAADWVGEAESRAGLSIMPDIVPEYVYVDATGELSGLGEIHRPGIWRAMIDAAPDQR